MALVTRAWLAGALVCGALGCGDPLVDETYEGTPRFRLRGSVTGASESVDVDNPELRVALFWVTGGAAPGERNVLTEQPGTALRAEFYRSFELLLFDEPGDSSLLRTPSGARYGVARLGAYRDENDNGRRDETEALLGASAARLLLRAPQDLSAAESPTGARLPEGWHVTSAPLECPASLGPPPANPEMVADGECGVPLGTSCRTDAECGGGVCLRDFIGPWPGGSCAIQEPPPDGCRQRGSTLLRDPQDTARAYWLKSCEVSTDCERAAPYQCDQASRACRPSADMPVELSDRGPPRSFCKAASTAPP
jgi:hypothetical protein